MFASLRSSELPQTPSVVMRMPSELPHTSERVGRVLDDTPGNGLKKSSPNYANSSLHSKGTGTPENLIERAMTYFLSAAKHPGDTYEIRVIGIEQPLKIRISTVNERQ
jgi:hypothetical protein